MAETTQSHTRHKEYSLVAAALAGALLLWLNTATGALPLVALNAVSIAAILGSAFSVVRHADVLAHRFGEPFGSLILSLAIVILEVGLISILMLSGAAGPARFGVGAIGSSGRAGPPGPAGPLTTPAPWPPAWVAAAIPPPADG